METIRFKAAMLVILVVSIIISLYILFQYRPRMPEEEEGLWLLDMDKAKMEAIKKYKPILIYFFTEFHENCIRMENETFTNNTLMGFLAEKFVLVKLDYNSAHARFWISYYGVKLNQLPTIVFASHEGDKISSIYGFKDSNTLYREALKALEEWKEK